jgi:peptidoglycan/LPS O-acetylase OafA/YrhL
LLATEYVFGFVMPDRSGLIPIIVTGTVGFLVSLLISYISYTYYESYFLRLKKKFTFVQTLEN